MSSPLISVVIPAYNHELYVKDAIRSTINQTYENLELIIIDDGSTDGTWNAICSMEAECQKRFSKVDFFTQKNCGTCATYNRLFEKAAGDYIYIINSDDVAHETAIEELHEFLDKNPDYALAVGDADYIDANGNSLLLTLPDEKGSPSLVRPASKELIKHIKENKEEISLKIKPKMFFVSAYDLYKYIRPDVDFNSDSFGEHSSFFISNYIPNGYIVRSDILKKIKLTNQAPREDYYMMFQISKAGKFKFINKPLHYYRYHESNTSRKHDMFTQSLDETCNYEMESCKQNMPEAEFRALIQKIAERKEKILNR